MKEDVVRTALTRQTLRIFWRHSRRYSWHVLFLCVGMFFVGLVQIYTPLVYRDLINVLADGPKASVVRNALWLVATVLLLNVVRQVVWRMVGLVNNRFQPHVMADLTNSCYQYLQKHSSLFLMETLLVVW